MTVEELMKPRYRVINIWPCMSKNIKVGDVLTFDNSLDCFWCGNTAYPQIKLNEYPHLFEELEWWEERKLEDMPKYLKFIRSGLVEKVKKYDMHNKGVIFKSNIMYQCYPGNFIPSTEEEYKKFNQ